MQSKQSNIYPSNFTQKWVYAHQEKNINSRNTNLPCTSKIKYRFRSLFVQLCIIKYHLWKYWKIMGSSSSTNTFILFLFSVVLLYCHIRSNKTNGEKLLNEEDNTLKGLFNEVFAINFSQKNLRVPRATQTILKTLFITGVKMTAVARVM